MVEDEDIREALFELEQLREREASALRIANSLLAGLERITAGAAGAPGGALAALLESVCSSLSCDAAAVLRITGEDARVDAASVPGMVGLVWTGGGRLAGKVRRLVDLGRAGWWDTAPPIIRARYAALLSAPIGLDTDGEACLVCLDRRPACFGAEDQKLLQRLTRLAGQAMAADELGERNALLAAVIDGSASGVAIADARDPELPLIYINKAFERLTGYGRDEVLGINCRFLTAEAPDSSERSRLRAAVQARSGGEFELLNVRRDGSTFWNRLNLFPIAGPHGQTEYMVATQVDVSERRAAEDQRDVAQTRLVSALSSTSEGFLVVGAAGEVLFANRRFRDFFEDGAAVWTPGADYVALWTARLEHYGMPHADAVRAARERREILYRGDVDREERLPDARVLLINDRPTPDGGAVSIATDITSLKATERLLAQRAAAIDAAEDGIAITDADGRFIYMNPSHYRMFGYESDLDVLGRHWTMLYSAEQAALVECTAMQAVEREGTWRGEIPGTTRDGVLVPQEVSLTRFPGVGLICVTRDVSERQQSEMERARLRDQLLTAQRQEALGQLAAGVAHDFNNVLSAISGSAALLKLDLPEQGKPVEHADRIIAASQNASKLVGRLMNLGARESETREVDLREPFREAHALLRSGVPSRIRLDVHEPDAPIVTHADPTDLLQIVLNLCINARDAIGPGNGEIDLSLKVIVAEGAPEGLRMGSLRAGEPYALIEVQDSGPGMDEATQERIFQPYFTTKGDAGTGLGLAVVSSVTKTLGGVLTLVSAPGEGARFGVYWPLAEAPRRAALTELPADGPAGNVRLDDAMILVVDDAADVGRVIGEAFQRVGAEVAVCEDPRDAAEAILEDPEAWTLLVTDFDMPQMNGAELARLVREKAPDVPIMLVTALAEQHLREGADDGLFDRILAKPVDTAHLVATAAAAILYDKKEMDE